MAGGGRGGRVGRGGRGGRGGRMGRGGKVGKRGFPISDPVSALIGVSGITGRPREAIWQKAREGLGFFKQVNPSVTTVATNRLEMDRHAKHNSHCNHTTLRGMVG